MAWQYVPVHPSPITTEPRRRKLRWQSRGGDRATFFKQAESGLLCFQGELRESGGSEQGGNIASNAVWSLWSELDNGAFTFPARC